jgi:hypothetical protein
MRSSLQVVLLGLGVPLTFMACADSESFRAPSDAGDSGLSPDASVGQTMPLELDGSIEDRADDDSPANEAEPDGLGHSDDDPDAASDNEATAASDDDATASEEQPEALPVDDGTLLEPLPGDDVVDPLDASSTETAPGDAAADGARDAGLPDASTEDAGVDAAVTDAGEAAPAILPDQPIPTTDPTVTTPATTAAPTTAPTTTSTRPRGDGESDPPSRGGSTGEAGSGAGGADGMGGTAAAGGDGGTSGAGGSGGEGGGVGENLKVGGIALAQTVADGPTDAYSRAIARFDVTPNPECPTIQVGACEIKQCGLEEPTGRTRVQAGKVDISGFDPIVALDWTQEYEGYKSAPLAGVLWTEPTPALLTVSGSTDVPGFSIQLSLPTRATLTMPLYEEGAIVDANQTVEVEWDNGIEGFVWVSFAPAAFPDSDAVVCKADAAAGFLTVDPVALAGLRGNVQYLVRQQLAEVKLVDDWRMVFAGVVRLRERTVVLSD